MAGPPYANAIVMAAIALVVIVVASLRIRHGLARPDGLPPLDRVAGWVVLLAVASFFCLGGLFWLALLVALPG